jgi:hypothetical protein
MTDQERKDIWKRLKKSKTVSSGIDMMLAMDMVSLYKENERLHKENNELQEELDKWIAEFMI